MFARCFQTFHQSISFSINKASPFKESKFYSLLILRRYIGMAVKVVTYWTLSSVFVCRINLALKDSKNCPLLVRKVVQVGGTKTNLNEFFSPYLLKNTRPETPKSNRIYLSFHILHNHDPKIRAGIIRILFLDIFLQVMNRHLYLEKTSHDISIIFFQMQWLIWWFC